MMRSVFKATLMFLFLVLTACSTNRDKRVEIKTHEQAFQHFDDIKFGMFIHWGIYAVPAGRWNGEYVRGIGEWIMSQKKIPVNEYEKLAAQFNPVRFDADEWAQLAEDAGMKYMVITSKHHDGFAMYDSKVSDFDIVDRTPFKKDPMKDLSAACRKRGIQFGFYYSHAQDWHEPNAAGNNWDFPEERNYSIYLRNKAIPQVREILSSYGPLFLVWFDTPRLLTREDAMELGNLVKEMQPACLVNSRLGHDQGDYEQMGDNAIPVQTYDRKWEVPATLNDTWGFKTDDHNWKEPKELIHKLIDIVSKGGNYLLNVGPDREGTIPQESQRILREIGKWLKVNGEAIYGTRFSPFVNDHIAWRYTTKPYKIYVHILTWPSDDVYISGLESKVKSAYFLANKESVEFDQDGEFTSFKVPKQPLDPYATVLVVEIEDENVKVAEGFRYNDPQEIQFLYAREARMRGEGLTYDWETHSASNFVQTPQPYNELFWYIYNPAEGSFQVDLEYNCPDEIAGSGFDVRCGQLNRDDESINGIIKGTGGNFETKNLGRINIAGGQRSVILKFRLLDDRSAQMKVRKMILRQLTS